DRLVRGEPRAGGLIGLGGVGKTRLAVEIAPVVGTSDGVAGRGAWIPLTPAARDGGLPTALAAAPAPRGGGPQRPAEAVAGTIGDAPALLVLDSVETAIHDLGLVDELVDLAPSLRIVLTSRIAVTRSGAASIVVEPLAVPREGDTPEQVAANPAVQLL